VASSEDFVTQAAHGAIMPERMASDLILSYSRPNDLVFDPFSGLATTAKMALLNHRRYLGMEIDPTFHAFGERRMRLAHVKYREKLDAMLAA
jgi:DNA modification methylase